MNTDTVCKDPKYLELYLRSGMRDAYVGDEALSKRGILTLKYPVTRGVVSNWDDTERLWHHCFYNELRVAPEEHPVLMTEPPLNPKANRERTVQTMFETFNVPAMYVAQNPALCLYAMGRVSGVVLDSGHGGTFVVPVYQRYVLAHGIQRLDFAGAEVTDLLVGSLSKSKVFEARTSAERIVVQDIKEKHAFVAEKGMLNHPFQPIPYELPDGEVINLGTDLCTATESLFDVSLRNPETESSPGTGLHELLAKAINSVDPELHPVLCRNIVLAGGNTLFPGIENRITTELSPLVSSPVKVLASPQRHMLSWIGASIFASMPEIDDMMIKKEEYDEVGPEIVHRKCT